MNKKSLLIMMLLTVSIGFTSCSISKVNKSYRTSINGTWTLDNISFDNSGHFKSTLFNDAPDICFEGSEWFFRENNSTGHYSLNKSSQCGSGFRYIRWSVVEGEINQLQFKFTDEKKKDLNSSGYRLMITSISDQEMVLKNNVMVDGERITIVYEFTKKSI